MCCKPFSRESLLKPRYDNWSVYVVIFKLRNNNTFLLNSIMYSVRLGIQMSGMYDFASNRIPGHVLKQIKRNRGH